MSNEPVVTRYEFPSADIASALRRVAVAHGVQDVYWDIWGREQRPDEDVQKAVLASVGVDISSVGSVDGSFRTWLFRERLALLPPCVVSSTAEAWLPVAFPAGTDSAASLTVSLEEGGALTAQGRLAELVVFETIDVDGAVWSPARLQQPYRFHNS